MMARVIESLNWPQDRKELAKLSITGLQSWYLSKDPTQMVFLGQNKDFRRFIWFHYTVPVRLLRLYYKILRLFKRG
jgi:hypothetical protein